jgi:hypothetical protein
MMIMPRFSNLIILSSNNMSIVRPVWRLTARNPLIVPIRMATKAEIKVMFRLYKSLPEGFRYAHP